MKTIEEIKTLIEDKTDYAELLKDTIIQLVGENKLVSCGGVFSHRYEDVIMDLRSAMVSNGKLFVFVDESWVDDNYAGFMFGALEIITQNVNYNSEKFAPNEEVCYVKLNAIKNFIHKLIYQKFMDKFKGKFNVNVIDYDFDNELSKEERKEIDTFISPKMFSEEYYDKVKDILKKGKGCIDGY